MKLLGVLGKSRSGKNAVCSMLAERGWAEVSLADPLKRACAEWFDWDEETLWGASENRNTPDKRYPRWLRLPSTARELSPDERVKTEALGQAFASTPDKYPRMTEVMTEYCKDMFTEYLTPRHALQQLGTEFGRECYPDVWVELMIRTAVKILDPAMSVRYSAAKGLSETSFPPAYKGVAVPDVRFKNEVSTIKKAGGKIVKIVRPGAGLSGAAGAHRSETEQDSIPESEFDFILQNDGTLLDLEKKVSAMMESFQDWR